MMTLLIQFFSLSPMTLLERIKHGLPRQCHLCRLTITPQDAHSLHSFWCQHCVERFIDTTPRCQRCGLRTVTPVEQCGQCLAQPPKWDRLYCINDYQAPLKAYVQKLKYRRQFWLASDLALLLAPMISEPCSEIIPVPLHWRRQWSRGFNQSAEIAHHLAKYWQKRECDCQVNHEVFRRIKATPQQKGLTKIERRRNTKRAFQLKNIPLTQHVALVDDVVTTGSTLEPLCVLLRKAGVKQIDVYCLSRTPTPN